MNLRAWVIGLALSVLAATAPAMGASSGKPELCNELEKFAKGLSPGDSRSVRLSLVKSEDFRMQKFCRADPNDAKAMAFCMYLSMHTSSEALGGNIMAMNSCIVGKTTRAAKGVYFSELSGKLTAHGLFSEAPDTDVEFEFFFRRSESGKDFMQITASWPKD